MKNYTRPQYYRIRRILEMIRAGTKRGELANASDFCSELEVTRRTILRDLDILRDDHAAPILYDASRKGYTLDDAEWILQPVELSTSEVFAFSIARKMLESFKGTAMEESMRIALAKISDSLEGKVTLSPDMMSDRMSVVADDYVVQNPEIWDAVTRMLDRSERMAVVYEKFNGEVKDYTLSPYHMVAYHGNWYVLAGSDRHDASSVRTFALSRIKSAVTTGEICETPADLDIQDHIAKSFGITRGEKVFRVRLLISCNIAAYIKERIWHPTQQMKERKDGSLELSFETAGWKELVRWILSWQPDVKVLSPAKLRQRIKTKMQQGLAAQ